MEYDDFERRHRDREERRRYRARRRGEHREHRERRSRDGAPKEKVLHTRISEQLADDIRSVAEDLRVPVSNLVRNVLEEAFSVVETVSENVGDLVEDILDDTEDARHRFRRYRRRFQGEEWESYGDGEEAPGEPPRDTVQAAAPETPPAEPATEEPVAERTRPTFAEVIGWQPLVLNRPVDCADCGRGIARGRRAFMGLTDGGASSSFLCRRCAEER